MIAAKVFKFLRANPGSRAQDISEGLGLRMCQVSGALDRLGGRVSVTGAHSRAYFWTALDGPVPTDGRGLSVNSIATLTPFHRRKSVRIRVPVKPQLTELERCWRGVVALNKTEEKTWI